MESFGALLESITGVKNPYWKVFHSVSLDTEGNPTMPMVQPPTHEGKIAGGVYSSVYLLPGKKSVVKVSNFDNCLLVPYLFHDPICDAFYSSFIHNTSPLNKKGAFWTLGMRGEWQNMPSTDIYAINIDKTYGPPCFRKQGETEDAYSEYLIATLLSKENVAVKILGMTVAPPCLNVCNFTSSPATFLFMEYAPITLLNFLKSNIQKEGEPVPNETSMLCNVIKVVVEMIAVMQQDRFQIMHNDLHLENILLVENTENLPFYEKFKARIRFTDFGLSVKYADPAILCCTVNNPKSKFGCVPDIYCPSYDVITFFCHLFHHIKWTSQRHNPLLIRILSWIFKLPDQTPIRKKSPRIIRTLSSERKRLPLSHFLESLFSDDDRDDERLQLLFARSERLEKVIQNLKQRRGKIFLKRTSPKKESRNFDVLEKIFSSFKEEHDYCRNNMPIDIRNLMDFSHVSASSLLDFIKNN